MAYTHTYLQALIDATPSGGVCNLQGLSFACTQDVNVTGSLLLKRGDISFSTGKALKFNTGLNRVRVEDLNIVGGGGVYIYRGMNYNFDRVNISYCDDECITMEGLYRARFQDCMFVHSLKGALLTAAALNPSGEDACHFIWMVNCNFESNDDYGIYCKEGTSVASVVRLVVEGGWFQPEYDNAAIDMELTYSTTISRCVFETAASPYMIDIDRGDKPVVQQCQFGVGTIRVQANTRGAVFRENVAPGTGFTFTDNGSNTVTVNNWPTSW